MPQKTIVVCETGGDKSNRIQGEIDWKGKKMIIEGMTKTLKEAKHKIGGTFSL